MIGINIASIQSKITNKYCESNNNSIAKCTKFTTILSRHQQYKSQSCYDNRNRQTTYLKIYNDQNPC